MNAVTPSIIICLLLSVSVAPTLFEPTTQNSDKILYIDNRNSKYKYHINSADTMGVQKEVKLLLVYSNQEGPLEGCRLE